MESQSWRNKHTGLCHAHWACSLYKFYPKNREKLVRRSYLGLPAVETWSWDGLQPARSRDVKGGMCGCCVSAVVPERKSGTSQRWWLMLRGLLRVGRDAAASSMSLVCVCTALLWVFNSSSISTICSQQKNCISTWYLWAGKPKPVCKQELTGSPQCNESFSLSLLSD